MEHSEQFKRLATFKLKLEEYISACDAFTLSLEKVLKGEKSGEKERNGEMGKR